MGVVSNEVEVQPGLKLSSLQDLGGSRSSSLMRRICLLIDSHWLKDGCHRPDEGEVTQVGPLGQQLIHISFNS